MEVVASLEYSGISSHRSCVNAKSQLTTPMLRPGCLWVIMGSHDEPVSREKHREYDEWPEFDMILPILSISLNADSPGSFCRGARSNRQARFSGTTSCSGASGSCPTVPTCMQVAALAALNGAGWSVRQTCRRVTSRHHPPCG